jgi:hypothetical protein
MLSYKRRTAGRTYISSGHCCSCFILKLENNNPNGKCDPPDVRVFVYAANNWHFDLGPLVADAVCKVIQHSPDFFPLCSDALLNFPLLVSLIPQNTSVLADLMRYYMIYNWGCLEEKGIRDTVSMHRKGSGLTLDLPCKLSLVNRT